MDVALEAVENGGANRVAGNHHTTGDAKRCVESQIGSRGGCNDPNRLGRMTG